MYVRVIDGTARRYTITDLRRANPNVSFPKELSDEALAEFNVYPLMPTKAPLGDVVTEATPVYNEATKQWEQQWSARDYTPDEVATNLAARRAEMIVTPRQARLALLGAGQLANIDAAIELLEEPTKSAVQIEWEYAVSIERMSPWVQAMTSALGMTDEQVDQLFEMAATL